MNQITNLVTIGKGYYIPLALNSEKLELQPSGLIIPANTITHFGSPFHLIHNEFFDNLPGGNNESSIEPLDLKAKAFVHFIERCQEKGDANGAEYMLLLEKFKAGKTVSSWLIHGVFNFF